MLIHLRAAGRPRPPPRPPLGRSPKCSQAVCSALVLARKCSAKNPSISVACESSREHVPRLGAAPTLGQRSCKRGGSDTGRSGRGKLPCTGAKRVKAADLPLSGRSAAPALDRGDSRASRAASTRKRSDHEQLRAAQQQQQARCPPAAARKYSSMISRAAAAGAGCRPGSATARPPWAAARGGPAPASGAAWAAARGPRASPRRRRALRTAWARPWRRGTRTGPSTTRATSCR